jgi:DNA modification methylase
MNGKIMTAITKTEYKQDKFYLDKIAHLDSELLAHFYEKIIFDQNLTRRIVSFQANKICRYYRWYKYKEAFSADLVKYLFHAFPVKKGKVLDPFAGSGTALFACSSLGYDVDGIELLPVGQEIIEANITARYSDKKKIVSVLERWLADKPWTQRGETENINMLNITTGAYSEETCKKIKRYLHDIKHEDVEAAKILSFSLLCILEQISYTRKDGQYLRWDYRSCRGNKNSSFDKGEIFAFDRSICKKLSEIRDDISLSGYMPSLFSELQPPDVREGGVHLKKGSCLEILPKLDAESYSSIITSPPYCNRYDYTRTYALELAMLGITEEQLLHLRQAMLSCTVENKEKELPALNKEWEKPLDICEKQMLMMNIISYLEYKRNNKQLNNNGIARMVRGYFYEMACVIQELHRVLQKDGYMFMVNDNVRYAGVAISVDLILSSIAEQIGFEVEKILVLPQGKGNSSQQMGKYGRDALRKCVYVWKKR